MDSFIYFCFIFGIAAKHSKLSFFAKYVSDIKLGISATLQFLCS